MSKINVSETLLSQLYNRNIKESFLEECLEDDDTRETYVVYLVLAAKWENKIQKDLYEFSREDILNLMSDNFTSSQSSLRVFYSICKRYGQWATERGYNKTLINTFELVNFNQQVLPMLNIKDLDKRYVSEEQLWEIIEGNYKDENGETLPICQNYQDAVCVVLPFYGIKGNRNAELSNLKISDILEDNRILLTDEDESTRVLELPEKVVNLMKAAYLEKEYIRRLKEKTIKNKKEGKNNNITKTIELEESNYILKKSVVAKRNKEKESNNDENGSRLLSGSIAARAKKILSVARYEKMSINNIFDSGKIHMLKQIEKEKGEPLTADDYKKVVKAFGDKTENYYEVNYWNIKTLYEQLVAISKAE